MRREAGILFPRLGERYGIGKGGKALPLLSELQRQESANPPSRQQGYMCVGVALICNWVESEPFGPPYHTGLPLKHIVAHMGALFKLAIVSIGVVHTCEPCCSRTDFHGKTIDLVIFKMGKRVTLLSSLHAGKDFGSTAVSGPDRVGSEIIQARVQYSPLLIRSPVLPMLLESR